MQRWIINDGIRGHLSQSQALAQHLGGAQHMVDIPWLASDISGIRPWLWFAPAYQWIPSRWRAALPTVSQATLLIACGRRAAQAALLMQQRQADLIETAQILDPRRCRHQFTRIITPLHDHLSANNVVTTAGALHQINHAQLQQAARYWSSRWQHLASPRLGILLGGGSLTAARREWTRLFQQLRGHLEAGGSYLLSSSRRTPSALQQEVEATLAPYSGQAHWVHQKSQQESNENPYLGILALADELWVSVDSINMMSEALCSPAKLHLWGTPKRRKEQRFIQLLEQQKYPVRSGTSTSTGHALREVLPAHWSS